MKRTMEIRLGSFSMVDMVTISSSCIVDGMKEVTLHTPLCSATISVLKDKKYHSKVVERENGIFGYKNDLYTYVTLEVGYSRRTSEDILKLEIIQALLSWGLKRIYKDFDNKEIPMVMNEFVPRYFPEIDTRADRIACALNLIKYGNSKNRKVSSDLISTYTKINIFDKESKKTKLNTESSINKMLDEVKMKYEDNTSMLSSVKLKYVNIINGHSFVDMTTAMILSMMMMRMCTFDENGKILIDKNWIDFKFAERFCGSGIDKSIFNIKE